MKYNSFSVHEKNIQSLVIEIYKVLNRLSPSILNKVFQTVKIFEITKNFVPEILRQLDMVLKLFHI